MDIRNHVTGAGYLGGEQTLPDGTSEVEAWANDADPWTAHVASVFRLTDENGNVAEVSIPAGQTYVKRFAGRSGNSFTYNIKTPAGAAVGVVVLT